MRKVLLISLAMLVGLISAADPPADLAAATKAVTAAEAEEKKMADAYKAAMTAAAKDAKVEKAEKAIKAVPALKKDATDADKKAHAETLAPLNEALGKAVDEATKDKTPYEDLVKAEKVTADAKLAVEGFYCDASKLDFALFTDDKCTKAVTGDAQKLPAGFADAVTSGLKDPKKACIAGGADKKVTHVKVECELVKGKPSIKVASFTDDKCTAAADKVDAVTIVEGKCSAFPATASTFVNVGEKAAAAEGMSVGMIILIVVICVVVCAALYFVKTKFFPGKAE